jgi:hypothetical protein
MVAAMDVVELVGLWLPEARVISVELLSGGFVNEIERVETDAGTFALRRCVSQTTAEGTSSFVIRLKELPVTGHHLRQDHGVSN